MLCFLMGTLQAVQRDKGGFVVVRVAADRLAEFFCRRGDVKNVVNNLKYKADFGRIANKGFANSSIRLNACRRAAQFHSGNDERTGLVGVQF